MPGRAIAGALAVALLTAAPASGGTQGPTMDLGNSHGLRYLKAEFESVMTPAGPTVDCPGERDVTGGGGTVDGNPATGFLTSTSANTAPEGWISEGRSEDAQLRTVTTYAICGSERVSHTQASDTYMDNVFNDAISCENEQHTALSGGIASDGGIVRVAGSYPTDVLFDWTISYQVEGSTTITRSVNCSKRYDVTYRSATERVKDGVSGSATRFCQADEAVAGGGFQVTRNDANQFNQWATATRPRDSKGEAGDAGKTPDDGWQARIYNASGQRVDLTTTAICAG